MTSVALILLGAGESSRFRDSSQCYSANLTTPLPATKLPKKQWLRLNEIPLWLQVAQNLHTAYTFSHCLLSAKASEIPYMQKYLSAFGLNFTLTSGGKTRQESLQNAINTLENLGGAEYVFVSDIARCNIPQDLSHRVLQELGHYDCVVPFLKLQDTIAYTDSNSALHYLKRENLKIIQTPQLSKLNVLKNALLKGEFTDESSAIYANGGTIGFVVGALEAKKLTFIEDLQDLQLPSPSKRTLVGSGSDIHALKAGNGIILGGIAIPCDLELIAHSDGDVCLHALCDGILGAIGAGDIGEWFPDNDMTYKGADSKDLLQKVVEFAYEVGYNILQADITIFAQKPKISPYKAAMESQIAQLLGIPHFKVNVKATTTEKLGFVGKGEGILTQATVVLEYFNWKTYHKGRI